MYLSHGAWHEKLFDVNWCMTRSKLVLLRVNTESGRWSTDGVSLLTTETCRCTTKNSDKGCGGLGNSFGLLKLVKFFLDGRGETLPNPFSRRKLLLNIQARHQIVRFRGGGDEIEREYGSGGLLSMLCGQSIAVWGCFLLGFVLELERESFRLLSD